MRCVVIDDDPIIRRILAEYIERTDFLIDAGSYGSLTEAIQALQINDNVENIDLIFLDVRFPEMSGFDFLENLDKTPQIIIMSVSEEYAIRAFDIGATDYLLKPIDYPRFFKSVTKALRGMGPVGPEEVLYLKKNAALVKVAYTDIIWIESMENYIRIHTDQERFVIHFTLKAIENHLPRAIFKRIHRSHIINLTRILAIEDSSVTLKGPKDETKVLPIGKSYKDDLINSLQYIILK